MKDKPSSQLSTTVNIIIRHASVGNICTVCGVFESSQQLNFPIVFLEYYQKVVLKCTWSSNCKGYNIAINIHLNSYN